MTSLTPDGAPAPLLPALSSSPIVEAAMLLVLLTLIAAIDLRTKRIPDPLNLVLGLAGLGVVLWSARDVADALLAAALGYIMIWGANAAYRSWRGRDGVGMGDAKLLAAIGIWVGLIGTPFVMLIGSSLAIMAVAALRSVGKQLGAMSELAFGPYLCVAAALVWLVQTFR